MTTAWQQFGAFIATAQNVTEWHLDQAKSVGIRWLLPVIYGDDVSGPYNVEHLPSLREYALTRGMQVGGWFNCTRPHDPEGLAADIARVTQEHRLPFIVLDVEEAYKPDDQQHPKITALMEAIRTHMPLKMAAISSFGFADRALIWRDLRRLHFRYLPQSYFRYDGRYAPEWCMRDLYLNAYQDPNIKDGIPLSYVHFTLSVVEGHDLEFGLSSALKAKSYGFTRGVSFYKLENMQSHHFDLIAQYQQLAAV